MQVEECIFFNIAKVNQIANRFWGSRLAGLNITFSQGLVLNLLYDGDGITSRALGERAILDSATLTGVLDRLEGQGLVKRKPNPSDRRAILIVLTEEGRALAGKVRRIMAEANHTFLEELGEEERVFRQILNRMRHIYGAKSARH